MISLPSRVSELEDDVTALSEHYAAWHVLVHPEVRAQFSAVLEREKSFFLPTAEAHFTCLCVSIYRLTDKRPDANSLPNILNDIRSLYPTLIDNIEMRLKPSNPVFDRISSIRNKVYAHRDNVTGPEMIFRVANLSFELISSCVSLLQDTIDTIAARCIAGRKEGDLIVRATGAADEIRRDLQRILAAL